MVGMSPKNGILENPYTRPNIKVPKSAEPDCRDYTLYTVLCCHMELTSDDLFLAFLVIFMIRLVVIFFMHQNYARHLFFYIKWSIFKCCKLFKKLKVDTVGGSRHPVYKKKSHTIGWSS